MIRNKVKKEIKFIDLFAGIGGFHLGIKQAAEKVGVKAECMAAVDIDKKARATYSIHFKKTPLLSDVTDPNVKLELPKHIDIVCGGFPCQPFSQAGKKLGIEDERGTLFTHIVDILKLTKPKAVFLENVRNLLNIKNNDGTKTIDSIKDALRDAGYPVTIQAFRATQFGLPTHRPRIYMVGFRKDILASPDKFNWPDPTHVEKPILSKYFKELGQEWDSVDPPVKRRGWPAEVGSTLRVGGAGSGFRGEDGNLKRDRRNWDSYMFFENGKGVNSRKNIHTLSVHEAKAIMGFPPEFSFGELSKLHAMKQLGNSVAVPVIQAIAKNIIETIHGRSNIA